MGLLGEVGEARASLGSVCKQYVEEISKCGRKIAANLRLSHEIPVKFGVVFFRGMTGADDGPGKSPIKTGRFHERIFLIEA